MFLSTCAAPLALFTLSLHDALPISPLCADCDRASSSPGLWLSTDAGIGTGTGLLREAQSTRTDAGPLATGCRSEEHTSELQSPCNLVCRLLLEKKKYICIRSA